MSDSLPKRGTHLVGVQRQYCGALGKVGNCQVAVSTALIAWKVASLISLELYLPQSWLTDDRRTRARIPPALAFHKEWRIALAHVRTVRAAGFTIEAVVADAPYGEAHQFRAEFERLGLAYVVAVPAHCRPAMDPDGHTISCEKQILAWRGTEAARNGCGPSSGGGGPSTWART